MAVRCNNAVPLLNPQVQGKKNTEMRNENEQ